MTAPSFTYSGNVYTGAAAGTVDFALTSTTGNPIAYLEPSHIHVYKSSNQGSTWTELTRPAQWDFVTSGTVARLVTGIAAGDWVKVQRITPSSPAYVTFQSSSLLTAEQLNDDTLFNTYLNQERSDQGDQSTLTANSASTAAASATTTANAATATANTALSTANTALSTANTASSNASAAVSTANTASTNATAAVTTANTASTNASAAVATANTASTNASSAVTTANTAAADASTALSTANTALSTANTALSTANTASTNASAAVTTANTASTNASNAVTTANTASTNATNAVNTANTASTNASNAVTTANTAISTANAAASAVASAILYDIVANAAAIPGSPANNDAVEVTDSTGIESFTPLAGVPGGFVGSSGLSVRLVYTTSGSTWNWIQYFPNDPESRYLKLSGGTLTGQLRADDSTSVASPVIAFDGDTNTGVAHTGADELALVTGGSARLTIDGSGNVAVPGTLGVTGAITGSLTGSASLNVLKAGDTMTGSLTAPALIPSGSTVPTNGLYLPSAGSVAISTNAVERLRIDSNGDLLSGTTGSLGYGGRNIILKSGQGYAGIASLTTESRFFSTWDSSAIPMTFYQGGSERMRLDSSGRLGLGTSSPQVLLDITDTGNQPKLRLSTATASNFLEISRSSSTGHYTFASEENGSSIIFATDPDGTGAQSRVTIDRYGKVGIGTTSPNSLLHVQGSSGTVTTTIKNTGGAAKLYVESSSGNSAQIDLTQSGTSSYTISHVGGSDALAFARDGSEAVRIDSSRRLLVGTSTSRSVAATVGARLQVEHQASAGVHGLTVVDVVDSAQIAFGTNNNGSVCSSGKLLARINFSGSDGTDMQNASAWIEAYADATWGNDDVPGRLVFSTTADGASSPTERMRIEESGRACFLSASSAGSTISSAHPASAGTSSAVFTGSYSATSILGGTVSIRIWNNGNIQNTNGSYTTLSDAKLKENIVDAGSQWDDLKAVKIRNWNFKKETGHETHRQIGPIAQELEQVCPGLVFETPDRNTDGSDLGTTTKGVNQSVLYMKAVKALQEAMERIEVLEQRLADAGIA